MRILVVDDELISRKKMKMIMDSLGECEAVECGKDAITSFQHAWENGTPFDLITLDILMPEMNGTQVLDKIRQIESEENIARDKRVKIFMVTSHSDKDTIINCVQTGCDDFITKPFNKDTVLKKLVNNGLYDETGNIRDSGGEDISQDLDASDKKEGILQDIIMRFKRGEIDLPALPQIHQKFEEMVVNGAHLQEIADLLKQDVAISSKLIAISNSSYYHGVTENKTLDQAISRLGLETTKQTVSAIANRSLYTAKNKKYAGLIEALWEHSLSCAYASQLVTDTLSLKFEEDAFTMGLLHDIGKLILAQVVGEMENRAQPEDEISEQSLFDVLNAYHGKTGAALLSRWGFSRVFTDVALYHDDIESAGEIAKELNVVCLANLLVKTMGYGQKEPLEINLIETESARALGLDTSNIVEIEKKVRQQIDELKQLLE